MVRRAPLTRTERRASLFTNEKKDTMFTLHIGDRAKDNSLIIHDEDRLCYQVLWLARGTRSVRTISKALLNEWVRAYAKNPDRTAQETRLDLVGKTDTDRFEYGYAATLATMAKMILGQILITRS